MRIKLLPLISVLCLFNGLLTAAPLILRVPADQPTIQQGIDAASPGDTVLVAPGNYHEHLDFEGKAITLISEQGPASTVLDGDYSGSIITFQNGESSNSVLAGFTLQRGFGPYGGAIALLGTSPSILSNIFDGNWQSPDSFGAAIGGDTASPLIARNLFRNNHSDGQTLSGIVSFINDSSITLAENIFISNDFRAVNLVVGESNSLRVLNNLFFGNSVGLRVVAATNSSVPIFQNNILVNNTAGLIAELGDGETLAGWTHNLAFHNGVNYQGISDPAGAGGNLSADPLFVCPVENDFHLLPGSPCVDAGDNFVLKFVRTDFDGNPRNVNGNGDSMMKVDLGPFEFDPAFPRIPCVYIICPANITVQAPAGARSANVNYPAPVACAGASIATSPASGASFRTGTNLVTCVATEGTNSAVCSFLVTVLAAPANDDFAAATVIPSLPYTNSQDTTLATVGPDDMFCGGLGPSVWYVITASEDEDIYVDTQGSDYPVSVSAYTGARGSLTQIGCALGILKIRALPGQQYHFMLSPFFRATGGNLALSIHAVPALKMQVFVDDRGTFDPRTGRATIWGTLTTSRSVPVNMAGTLTQDRGRGHHVSARFNLSTSCAGKASWSATLQQRVSDRFDGGPAELELAGFAFDAEAGDSADTQLKISIKLSASDCDPKDGGRDAHDPVDRVHLARHQR